MEHETTYNYRITRYFMNAVKIIKRENVRFFFHALVKIGAIRFILPNEARRTGTGGGWAAGVVFGIQDTALTMRARGVSTLHGRGRGSRRGGEHTFGTPALYIAEKPDLPGNKNFFLHPSCACPLLRAPSTCNPLLIPPSFSLSRHSPPSLPSVRFSFALVSLGR